jgi:hypothetical protein
MFIDDTGHVKRSARARSHLCKTLHKKAWKQDIYLYKSISCEFFSLGTGSAKRVPVEIISTVSTLRKKSWISLSMF